MKLTEAVKDAVPSPKPLKRMKKMKSVVEKLPLGSNGQDEESQEGVGDGRRMPIQQAVDVAVPVEAAWKLWNRYEDYPKFMHRVESAEKPGPKSVRFASKV